MRKILFFISLFLFSATLFSQETKNVYEITLKNGERYEGTFLKIDRINDQMILTIIDSTGNEIKINSNDIKYQKKKKLSSFYSQESTQTHFGIGVTTAGIKDLFLFVEGRGDIAPTIFVPISISSNFRIEPAIGFIQLSSDRDREPEYRSKSTSKSFHIGIGFFPVIPKEKYSLYYGTRLGFIKTSSSSEYSYSWGSHDSEESTSGFFVAPAIGGEYFLSDHFSLGGEAQVRYTSLSGEETETNNEREVTDLSSSSTSTRALIFIRFYF